MIGGFATAFGDGVTSRSALARNGVGSYLLESACNGHSLDYFGHVRNDLLTLGALLHKQPKATATDWPPWTPTSPVPEPWPARRNRCQCSIWTAKSKASTAKDGAVLSPRCWTLPGAQYLFADINQYRVTVSRETLLVSDPDVILLADADWSPASRKRYLLTHDPVLSQLRAVRENRLIDIPFTQLLPTFSQRSRGTRTGPTTQRPAKK